MTERTRIMLAITLIAIAIGSVVGVGFAILWTHSDPGKDVSSDLRWALIPILCAAGFMVILLIFSFVFSLLNIADKSQALALPEGSIRSIIALVLLSMFIVVPVYLLSQFSDDLKSIPNVDSAGVESFKSLGGTEFVAAVPVSSTPIGTTPSAYTVFYRQVGAVKGDFAKP